MRRKETYLLMNVLVSVYRTTSYYLDTDVLQIAFTIILLIVLTLLLS